MNRARFFVLPLLLAAIYTALLVTVGALSVNPNIAQMHPGSLRYELGGVLDQIYPIISIPIRPLGALGALGIDIPAGVEVPLVFGYTFLLFCAVIGLVRRAQTIRASADSIRSGPRLYSRPD